MKIRGKLGEFMNALAHCDMVKVILTGCGETEFSTKEIHESISQLILENRELLSKLMEEDTNE